MRRATRIPLRMTKGRDGKVIRGLWESDVVRMEAVENGWECQVTLRRIGMTNYFEFSPLSHGGNWKTIGTLKTLDNCCAVAEWLKDGTHVLRGAFRDEFGKWPRMIVEWSKVAEEIANHPSVKG